MGAVEVCGVKVEREPQTTAEIRAAAQAWYVAQMAKAERALGPAWPAMRASRGLWAGGRWA
jgi:hypothetical protein